MVIKPKRETGKNEARAYRYTVNTARKTHAKLVAMKLQTGYTVGELVEMAINHFIKTAKIKYPNHRTEWLVVK